MQSIVPEQLRALEFLSHAASVEDAMIPADEACQCDLLARCHQAPVSKQNDVCARWGVQLRQLLGHDWQDNENLHRLVFACNEAAQVVGVPVEDRSRCLALEVRNIRIEAENDLLNVMEGTIPGISRTSESGPSGRRDAIAFIRDMLTPLAQQARARLK